MGLGRSCTYRYGNTLMLAFLCFLLCASLFFLSSCGIEVYYDIEPPRNAVRSNQADGSSTTTSIISNAESQKFEFRAVPVNNFIAAGTAVYYRIYNNIADLQRDADLIDDVNDENTSKGYDKLKSLKYFAMNSNTNAVPLIGKAGGQVIIRLFKDKDTAGDLYAAGIFVDGTSIAIPMRYDVNDGVFNFDPDTHVEDYNQPPEEDDQDYDYNSGTPDGNDLWYVNAYAVSTGLNPTAYTPAFSQVLSLGFIAYSQDKN